MGNHATHIATAVLFAAAAVACGGHSEAVDGNQAAASPQASAPAAQSLKLSGCVGPGSRANGEFVLSEVMWPSADPQGRTQTAAHAPIANGQWVRLIGDASTIQSHLGKRVEVTGRIQDSGANTLGTSGRVTPAKEGQTPHEKVEQSSKDAHTSPDRNMPPTTVAPVGADANGVAPSVAVDSISEVAGTCEAGKKSPGLQD